MTADEALERLKEGNRRFYTKRSQGPGEVGDRHAELIKGQEPFAIMLSCSDSRVPTEILFDTRLGDLFVVRVAGNVANTSSIASVEYAVAQLGTKLILVMAHENCGAVAAAMAGGAPSKNLGQLLSHIKPALEPGEADVNVIARRNAKVSAQRLVEESAIIRDANKTGGVRIVRAFFRFSDGVVEFEE